LIFACLSQHPVSIKTYSFTSFHLHSLGLFWPIFFKQMEPPAQRETRSTHIYYFLTLNVPLPKVSEKAKIANSPFGKFAISEILTIS